MKDRIKEIFMELGADLCGIANIIRFENAVPGFHPTDIYDQCKTVIVFAKRLPRGLAVVSPRIVYNKAKDVNIELLDQIAYNASLQLEDLGCIAIPVPADSPYDYWNAEKLEGRGIISMRHAAKLAGIGTLGKNTLLLNETFGNMIGIGAVLTNLDLESDPFSKEICIDNCRLCLDNCPSKALDGDTVIQNLCREYTYEDNERGFGVCKCNKCRLICPRAFGVKKHAI